MASLNPQQEKSITALIAALGQQEESLPTGLQKQLYAIGQNLESRAVEIPAIAASLPDLSQAYQTALTADEGASAQLVSNANQDSSDQLLENAKTIFTASDPVNAAQRSLSRTLGQIASNPLKRLFNRG